MRFATILSVFALIALPSCGTSIEEKGGEGQPCFKDGTCNEGYYCNDDFICEHAGGEDERCLKGGICETGLCCVVGYTCRAPDCSGRVCGEDPVCSESCGTCQENERCDNGQCILE